MAIARQFQTAVTTNAIVLDGTQYPSYLLKNDDASLTLFIGDSSVTTSNGFPIGPGDVFSPSELAHRSLRGLPEDRLYGIAASGSIDVRVLIPSRVNV